MRKVFLMEAERNLQLLLQDEALPADLKHIAQKVLNSESITFDEGVLLYEKADLSFVGVLANYNWRLGRHGQLFSAVMHVTVPRPIGEAESCIS